MWLQNFVSARVCPKEIRNAYEINLNYLRGWFLCPLKVPLLPILYLRARRRQICQSIAADMVLRSLKLIHKAKTLEHDLDINGKSLNARGHQTI
jgi:hypothetical protein